MPLCLLLIKELVGIKAEKEKTGMFNLEMSD
jgi:hypothetical protein